MVACENLALFLGELKSERRYDVVLIDLRLRGFEPGPDGRRPNGGWN